LDISFDDTVALVIDDTAIDEVGKEDEIG